MSEIQLVGSVFLMVVFGLGMYALGKHHEFQRWHLSNKRMDERDDEVKALWRQRNRT